MGDKKRKLTQTPIEDEQRVEPEGKKLKHEKAGKKDKKEKKDKKRKPGDDEGDKPEAVAETETEAKDVNGAVEQATEEVNGDQTKPRKQEKKETKSKRDKAEKKERVEKKRKAKAENEEAQEGDNEDGGDAMDVDVKLKSKEEKKQEKKDKKKAKKEKKNEQSEPARPDEQPTEPTEPQEQSEDQKDTRFIAFVGNLPYSANTDSIKAHFTKNPPASIRVATEKDKPSKCRGFAFIEFENFDRMKTCLKLYHHSTFDDGKYPPRRINVELTAGGGGKSTHRQAKISAKNQKLNVERQRRAKQMHKEKDRKTRNCEGGDDQQDNDAQDQYQGYGQGQVDDADNGGDFAGMHPSRRGRMQ